MYDDYENEAFPEQSVMEMSSGGEEGISGQRIIIDTKAIAEACSDAINGPNGKDLLGTVKTGMKYATWIIALVVLLKYLPDFLLKMKKLLPTG